MEEPAILGQPESCFRTDLSWHQPLDEIFEVLLSEIFALLTDMSYSLALFYAEDSITS